MQEIKLIDLQEIALPNWLPNIYIQALADIITSTGFVPPIICLDDELLTPDVVAALRTIKARNESPGVAVPFIPAGVAVMGDRWLVKVDRRVSKVITKIEHEHHYHNDWYRYVRPVPIWRDAYWTYTNHHSIGGIGGANITASWSADQPTLSVTNGLLNSGANNISEQFGSALMVGNKGAT